jgi:hypothetical protein
LGRDVRNALGEDFYHDIDMVNAQPVLLAQYCEQKGMACKAVSHYIANREALLLELCKHLGCERWEAKQKAVSIFFGANASELTPFFCDQLAPELRCIMGLVWAANKDTLKFLKGKDNHEAKALAYILQTEERKCLMAMEKALQKWDRDLTTYMHDGGLVPKLPGEEEFPESLLRQLEADVLELSGYSVSLAVKPMESSLTAVDMVAKEKEQYKQMKAKVEASYFKLMHPACFARVTEDGCKLLSGNDLHHQLQNLPSIGDSNFLGMWLHDETIRTYEKLAFAPKLTVPETCYNLWAGFDVQPKPGADISIVSELLGLISGHDAATAAYIEKWVAHIIQRPSQKTKTCLVVQGKQGVGKDTYFDFIGKLMGKRSFYNTSAPETDVFARFNDGMESCLLVKFEEADFQTNKANASKLKSIITCETVNVETKGVPRVTLDDYRNFVMTTNQEVPVLLEDQERRFVLVKASDARKGDFAFWNKLHAELAKPEVREAYMHHLLSLDLSGFCPFRDRHITEYYKETAQVFVPYHARFLQRLVEETSDTDIKMTARELFNQVKDYTQAKYELTETKFGRDMKNYLEANVLARLRSTSGNVYHIPHTGNLREFMIDRGWWVDY